MLFRFTGSRKSLLARLTCLFVLFPGIAVAAGDYDLESWLSASNSVRPGNFGDSRLRTTLGFGGVVAPEYMGSDEYEVKPLPMVELVYGGRLFASTQQGIGYNLWRRRTIRAGPRITFDLGRESSDYAAIATLPDVEFGVEAGLFFEAYKGAWRWRGDVRYELGGGYNSLFGNIDVAWGQRWTENASIIVGGNMTVMGEGYAQSYFGVPASSATSSLPSYSADAGIRDVSGYAQLVFDFSKRFYLAFETRGTLYLMSAADSPVTINDATLATSAVAGVRF
jgi:outer membrane protein